MNLCDRCLCNTQQFFELKWWSHSSSGESKLKHEESEIVNCSLNRKRWQKVSCFARPTFFLDCVGIGQGSVQLKCHTTQGFHQPPVSKFGGVLTRCSPNLQWLGSLPDLLQRATVDPSELSIAVVKLTIVSHAMPTRAGATHWTLGLLNCMDCPTNHFEFEIFVDSCCSHFEPA